MSPPEENHSEPSAPLRLFTAVSLSAQMKEKVADLLSRLKKGMAFTGAHPTWVAAENVHITLVFLGDTPAERVSAVREALDEAAGAGAPFELRLGGLHLFPTPKEPRVISLGMSGDLKSLGQVRESLADGLRNRAFDVESRPFRPHLTLARIKSMRGLSGLRDLISSHQRMDLGRFAVDHLTLYQSTLRPTGPTYDVLHEPPLSGTAAE